MYHYTISNELHSIKFAESCFLEYSYQLIITPCHFIQVHIVLSTVGQSSNSLDLNGDYSSEDNDTDISDTDDEDEWDGAVTQV